MIWLVHWFIKITGWIPQLFVFRKKIYYEDKKVQSRRIKGKAIVVSNHYDVWDYPLMMFVFWRRSLRCQIAELMYEKNIFLTLVLKGLGGIKVNRETHDFSFVAKSLKVLDKKGVVQIFPESRLPTPGEETPLPFKPSAAWIAMLSEAPISPVAHNGKYFGKGRSRVIIGKPIDVREWYQEDLEEKENIRIINEKLRERIIELQHELERQTKEEKEKKTV